MKTGITTEPVRTFLVGRARAAVWRDEFGQKRVAIEVKVQVTPTHAQYQSLLEPSDITPAILALKKARDFVCGASESSVEENSDAIQLRLPERIP